MVLAPREHPHVPPDEPSWWHAWVASSDFYVDTAQRPRADENAIRRELLFCLLGGHGITYELAESAWERVIEVGCLAGDWDLAELEGLLEREFSSPQFRPVRRDGSLRRYRYPRSKARLVVAALRWLEPQGSLTVALENLNGERERRKLLCRCPGVGPKTASWILRNTGYAVELAILDVHVIRAMEREGRRPPGRLPAAYELVEAAFLEWCRELDVPPASFDLFLWEWERAQWHDRAWPEGKRVLPRARHDPDGSHGAGPIASAR